GSSSQSRHHSWHAPDRPSSPQGFAGVSMTRGGRSRVLAGRSSPHGKRASSSPPRAAFSHCASVGSWKRSRRSPDSHRQYPVASNQLTPTTGCPGSAKRASSHHGGGGVRVDSRNGAYSALVTGLRSMAKASSQT